MYILTTWYGKKICAGSYQKCKATWWHTEGFAYIYKIEGRNAVRVR